MILNDLEYQVTKEHIEWFKRALALLNALDNRPLAKVEITPLNPPLIRGEKLQILPPPLTKGRAGEGSFMDFCKRSNELKQTNPIMWQLNHRWSAESAR